MPSTTDTSPPPATGPGEGFVPRSVIIALSVLCTLLAAVTLYSVWAYWPETGPGQSVTRPQQVEWFGWTTSISREFLFFLAVALAGALGGLIHTIRSFSWYIGNRDLRWS